HDDGVRTSDHRAVVGAFARGDRAHARTVCGARVARASLPWMAATSERTAASASGVDQMFRPKAMPAPPARIESATCPVIGLSDFAPPRMITGTPAPSVT